MLKFIEVFHFCKSWMLEKKAYLQFICVSPESQMLFLIEVSVQFISVAQSCPTLCDPMNCSTPGLPVHHQLPEFTQTHVHQVGDTIQPSHPLSSPPPPPLNLSQHPGLFQLFESGGQSIGVSASTSVLPMNTRTDLL